MGDLLSLAAIGSPPPRRFSPLVRLPYVGDPQDPATFLRCCGERVVGEEESGGCDANPHWTRTGGDHGRAGRKRFDMGAPVGPFGTKEAPAVVQSWYNKRIFGCPGGEEGRGGSGSVFKGILREGLPRDGLTIAVKRIEGGEKQFHSEISAIVAARHVNLVTIVGYCPLRQGYCFLVYEFMQNGSLDSWIFSARGDTERYLKWETRYQVAINVAKALAYLHLDLRNRILHLDVKPENILLDKNFRAIVSDFGISRIMGTDESRVLTRTRGTRGYYAPEWFSKEGITEKSDVYSYGMVLLELLTGQRNLKNFDDRRSWVYFPKIVSEKMREGKLMEVVDERLMKDGSIKEDEATILVYVALWCIQDRPELRPTMEDVVCMLKGHATVVMPPETRMYILDYMYSDPDTVSGLSRAQSSDTPKQRDFHSISFSSQSSSESTRSIYFSTQLSSADGCDTLELGETPCHCEAHGSPV